MNKIKKTSVKKLTIQDAILQRVDEVLSRVDLLLEKSSPQKPKEGNILDQIYEKLGPWEMCKRISELQTMEKWKLYWMDLSMYQTYSPELQEKIKKSWHRLFAEDLQGSME